MTAPYDAFYEGVVEAMLYAETDDRGQPLDAHYTEADLSDLARCTLLNECSRFLSAARSHSPSPLPEGTDLQQAGHDFWFTRQGHGTGFWDKEHVYGEAEAALLCTMSKCFGECWPGVGDDGKIYLN